MKVNGIQMESVWEAATAWVLELSPGHVKSTGTLSTHHVGMLVCSSIMGTQ